MHESLSGVSVRDLRRLRHKVVVLPWLRRPAQRLIMPNWLAITIGPLILAWRPLDEAELAHELAHVSQWRRYGLRFIPLYFAASADAERSGGHRYRDNVFEIEARAVAGQESDLQKLRDRWGRP